MLVNHTGYRNRSSYWLVSPGDVGAFKGKREKGNKSRVLAAPGRAEEAVILRSALPGDLLLEKA